MSRTKAEANAEAKTAEPTPPEMVEEPKDTRSDDEKAWQERQDRLRVEQGLGPDAVPEDRELRYTSPPESAVVTALREAGDPRGMQVPAHGFKEYQRADSEAQKRKAA